MDDFLKKSRLIDVGLVIIIIVMAVFVVIELSRTFDFMRQTLRPMEPVQDPISIEEPVATIGLDSENPQSSGFNLVDLDGESVTLSELKGTPVLVNFWATWCPPCLAEMPLIQTYADKHAGDLIVLAINAGEDEAIVRDFVERQELNLTFLLDPDNNASSNFRVYGFPTTLFFDSNGYLQATHIGELNEALIELYLQKVGIEE
jgi:thiol-disulfide isomerase/thioredoxin